MVTKDSKLEAIIVPTGPSKEIDMWRALAGVGNFEQKDQTPGIDPYIIISGVYNSGTYEGSQTEYIQNQLRFNGVSKDHIEHESRSRDTRENVIYTGEILHKKNTSLASITTDYWHALRMRMLFKRAIQKGFAPEDLQIELFSEGIPN
ncbi:YdcF family protein [archaeon]|jgi:uncharacterized SAM-binding protein YcdF (DUF218 family)|nr:YdcF family protein [archaeon]MBT6182870.1 YdcF family protein [archaeon]MBT6606727.1 YdcF family protein [archaeon]MBT7251285.1 YdcF family protein [archaeon]MBT7661213.1 YdcF family protein [archaeon]